MSLVLQPCDCPEFDYESHPERQGLIPKRVAIIIKNLMARPHTAPALARDTRSAHGEIFFGLTPSGHEYYAGHYRGENFPCLKHSWVTVGGRRCSGPQLVSFYMTILESKIDQALAALDSAKDSIAISPAVKVLHTVQVACRFFERICWVHPYKNGNGHAARFCLWAILLRYGLFPTDWPIEPRPQEPNYTDLLKDYRNGNPSALERYVLQRIRRVSV